MIDMHCDVNAIAFFFISWHAVQSNMHEKEHGSITWSANFPRCTTLPPMIALLTKTR